jgi:hypothetical protein
MEQLALTFEDSAVQRTKRAKAHDPDQLTMFAFAANIDVHLHSPSTAVAVISGSFPERTIEWLSRIVGQTTPSASKRVFFPTSRLDRLLVVRPPAHVTLDASALAVARALWAHALGLKPLRVTRHRQRLLASSPRWPTGLGVVDAPWPAISTLVGLKVPLDVEPKAKALMHEKLSGEGVALANAWLAGSAVMLETNQPELLEAIGLPALSYAAGPDSGRYRMPLLASASLLDEPAIMMTDELVTAIKRATAKTRPLSSLEGFPWELYPFQARDAARAVRILETSGGVLLAGEMGSGKGLPLDTIIYTPSGPRPVAALRVGDEVLGSNGQPTKITGVYPQGVQQLYRITFTDASSLITDGAHLWTVHSPSQNEFHRGVESSSTDAVLPTSYLEPVVRSTADLAATPLTEQNGNHRWYIPLVTAPLDFDTPTPPVPGYVLGAMLADESLVYTTPRPTDITSETADQVQTELDASSLRGIERTDQGVSTSYRLANTVRPKRLTEHLVEIGLFDLRAHEKFIPDVYKFAPASTRLAVLQGLLDTDGRVVSTHSPSSIEFCSTSERLVDDLTWIVESLGGTARKSSARQTTYPHRPLASDTLDQHPGRLSWRLSIALPPAIAPFRLETKASLYRTRTKYLPTRGITAIEPVHSGPTVCIAVDAPDALYVTEHALVTHNTTVALALAHSMELWPALVVCPLAAMSTWARQLGEMGKTFYMATEAPALSWKTIETGTFDAVVISYDRLHAFSEVIEHAGFTTIIADELQRVRTPSSRRSRALRTLAQTVPVRIGLSGTPLQNRIEDLLAPASFLVPGEFKPRATAKNLADLYPGDPVEAIAEHVGTLMVRRRMEDTGVSLPNKTVRRLFVDLTADQRHALANLEAEAEASKDDGSLDRMHAFAKLQRMRQIISCPIMANVQGGSPKVAAALELVDEFVTLDRKCVVFCANRRTWTDLADGLKARGIGYTGIWGSTPIADRIANERAFHNDPSVKVFIGTIQSCAESLTLSPTGTVVIHCDYVYNPSDLAQAEARVYRMNQVNPVEIIYLHASAPNGTLDDRMAAILEVKRALFAQVIDRTEHQDNTQVSYSLGDLVYLLTGERDARIDQREADSKAVIAREQAMKRHAKVTIYKHKGKNKHSDDFFDDGSMALLRDDLVADNLDEGVLEAILDGDLDKLEHDDHDIDLDDDHFDASDEASDSED